MFDDTYILTVFKEIWETVFNSLDLNTEYIYLHNDYRNLADANMPSIVIRKINGNVSQLDCGVNETKAAKSGLLRIWNRSVNYETQIRTEIKGKIPFQNIYSSRLFSLFLRGFDISGNVFDAGTLDDDDLYIDQKRECVIGTISETKPRVENINGRLIEILTIIIPVQFYEYYQIF